MAFVDMIFTCFGDRWEVPALFGSPAVNQRSFPTECFPIVLFIFRHVLVDSGSIQERPGTILTFENFL